MLIALDSANVITCALGNGGRRARVGYAAAVQYGFVRQRLFNRQIALHALTGLQLLTVKVGRMEYCGGKVGG